jgi:hypothetical protein
LAIRIEGRKRIDVRELDGPCFHHAREALGTAKSSGRWALISGVPGPFQLAINSILRLTGEIRAGWTDRQVEVVRARRTRPLQKDIAHDLGVHPSVISGILSAAQHDAVCEAEDAVAALLNRAVHPDEFPPPDLEGEDDE